MKEILIVAAVAIVIYLIQQLRLLPNSKIEAQSFVKSREKIKSLSHLAKLLYTIKFIGTLLLVGVVGNLFAAVIGGTIGLATSIIPDAPKIPDVTLFDVKVGVLNLGLAVLAGFIGPDRSFGKIADRVLLGEEGSKQLWLKKQEEKLGAPIDISENSGDNEGNNSQNQ